MSTDCPHPSNRVEITSLGAQEEVGNLVPKYWTIIGVCHQCESMVEIDFKLTEITDAVTVEEEPNTG